MLKMAWGHIQKRWGAFIFFFLVRAERDCNDVRGGAAAAVVLLQKAARRRTEIK